MNYEENKHTILTHRELGYWLNNIHGIGLKKINDLLDYFHSYENVFDATSEELKKVKSITENNIGAILNSRNSSKIKEKILFMDKKGYNFVLRDDTNYPKKLKDIYNPPHILYYRGKLPHEKVPCIAIVGARECTQYGVYHAYRLAEELASYGFQIVSGLARGIDVAAHKGALNNGGSTFGVLGCGVDVCYPKENIETFMSTIKSGGIISEYPIYTTPRAGNFPMRNRIISALCDGVLVIEARRKSGSLITVDFALEHGKEVYVVPGRIDSLLSEGCNNLIKLGAKVVTRVEDIVEDYGEQLHFCKKNKCINNCEIKENQHIDFEKKKIFLESHEKIVYASLRLESKHIDEIVYETGFSIGEVIKILFDLEEKGLVVQRYNNYYERLNLG